MPPKAKQSVQDWNQCIKCDRIINYKELSKHKEECEANKPISHGHVFKHILYGVACPTPEGIGNGYIDEFYQRLSMF